MPHTEGMWWTFLKAVKDRQHRVAPTTWVAAIAAVVYTVAPIDMIPELLLGPLGFVDDIGVWSIFAVLFAREQRRWLDGLGTK
ncbi:YkvA family protein [uncultured Microbacterium sp.]|uniref:YkvA family protein n=1 Tax=uncultured Microbacterium sp. TaxID=191216 RepID=UPI0028D5782C|nr:YkvA family protein [uncultured Microbacterium sp.]